MLVTTYGLAKTGLGVTQFSVARDALLPQSGLRFTQFCVAIDQSGARLHVVMGFLGLARYNVRTNEHVASMKRVTLDSLLSFDLRSIQALVVHIRCTPTIRWLVYHANILNCFVDTNMKIDVKI